MLKNFFITTLRVLYRNKGFAAINILGLAIGIACCIFIALYINHEVSFDRFHKNSHRLHRLTVKFSLENEKRDNLGITPPAIGADLLEAIPEIESILRLGPTEGDFIYNEKMVSARSLYHADTTLWDILDFKLLVGDKKTVLKNPFSIVLSETLASTIFGEENPIGKIIMKDGANPYTVTGIVEDAPSNTRLKYNGFISFSTLYNIRTGTMTEWDGNFSFLTFLLLNHGANPKEVSRKATEMADQGINMKMAEINGRFDIGLQSIRDIHLHNDLNYEKAGAARVLYIISAIALFILFIAGFNFVNLTTARSTRRAKEVGLRMTVGASKSLIRWQFLGESILLAIVSTLISLIVVELFMPTYNNILGLNLSLYNREAWAIGFSLPIFVLLFGLLAGLYPALFLSSFSPIRVLKADFGGVRAKSTIRNILVTLQFVVSSLLIISTAIVYLQLNHLKEKDLGLNTEGLTVAQAKGENIWQRVESIKNSLMSIPEVEGVGFSTAAIGQGMTQNGYVLEGVDKPVMARALGIDYDYLNVIGATISKGRNLSVQFPSDETAVIVNQTLVEIAGWDDPIGKRIEREKNFVVVGVVEDFHYKSLHEEIEPLIMFLPFHHYLWSSPVANIKLKEGVYEEGLNKIRNTWDEMGMAISYNYMFVQDIFDSHYKAEENFAKLFIYFSFFAVFISCLGLLGLSSFMLENRRREIGIRKVMGSGITAIISRFSIDFTRWALLGTIISWPIAFYAINKLLSIYPYRISIPWLVFILAALVTFTISLATILIQTYKAARTNPVETLKCE